MAFVSTQFTNNTGSGVAIGSWVDPDGTSVGSAFTQHPHSGRNLFVSTAGRVHTIGTNEALWLASGVPGSADYDVEGALDAIGTVVSVGSGAMGVVGRAHATDHTYIGFWYSWAQGQWLLVERVGGTLTTLDTFAEVLATSDSRDFKLEMRGTAAKGYVDGVEVCSGTVSVTDAGRVGIRAAGGPDSDSETEGAHLTSMTATEVVASGAPTVNITSPSASGVTVPAGTELVARASATDDTDGDISASTQWTSSNTADGTGGDLGTGASITIDTTGWESGDRTITAIATNSGALEGSDSFTLAIGASGAGTIILEDAMYFARQAGVATTIPIRLRDTNGAVLTSNPLAPGDVTISIDGAAATVLDDDASAASWTFVNGRVYVPLSAAEVTGGEVTILVHDQSASAFLDATADVLVTADDITAAGETPAEVADALLGRNVSGGSDGGVTVAHVLRGDVDIALDGSGGYTVQSKDGGTTLSSGTYTVNADGSLSLNAA